MRPLEDLGLDAVTTCSQSPGSRQAGCGQISRDLCELGASHNGYLSSVPEP